jgi:hypothetical protein
MVYAGRLFVEEAGQFRGSEFLVAVIYQHSEYVSAVHSLSLSTYIDPV